MRSSSGTESFVLASCTIDRRPNILDRVAAVWLWYRTINISRPVGIVALRTEVKCPVLESHRVKLVGIAVDRRRRMTWRAPTRRGLVHYPDVVMRLARALLLDRTIGNEIGIFSVSRDLGIGVLILTGERRNLRLRPAAVIVARNKGRPMREIRRHL